MEPKPGIIMVTILAFTGFVIWAWTKIRPKRKATLQDHLNLQLICPPKPPLWQDQETR